MNFVSSIILPTQLLSTFFSSIKSNVIPFGHFEDSTEKSLTELSDRVMLPPEYAPAKGVMLSSELFSYGSDNYIAEIAKGNIDEIWFLVPEKGSAAEKKITQKIEAEVGSHKNKLRFIDLVKNPDTGKSVRGFDETVWTRDWAPFFGWINNSAVPNSEIQTGNTLAMMDFNYYPSRPFDDATGRALERKFSQPNQPSNSAEWINNTVRGSVPLYLEGGNFMITGKGTCAVTRKILTVNSSKVIPEDIVFSEPEVKKMLEKTLGCKNTIFFERLPQESTGHIDMWAKFVSDSEVFVGEIDPEVLEKVGQKLNSDDRNLAFKVKEFLNEQALVFARNGFQVTRIPMPIPYGGVYRSYTNSLFLNGTAYIPRYIEENGYSYYDFDYLKAYESQVDLKYRNAGFKPIFLKSDRLIASGGAIHCTSMQISQPPFK